MSPTPRPATTPQLGPPQPPPPIIKNQRPQTAPTLASHRVDRSMENSAVLTRQLAAYIAASHRPSRPLAARIASAHRAADVHEQLTGHRLLITRELVMAGARYPPMP
ncbi:hypothetical protein BC828DRAFT_382711 [Blastocladiella britannica]|nr:hypothetical protein BC828DRAFT_382711 [Blastocladiella britannica]